MPNSKRKTDNLIIPEIKEHLVRPRLNTLLSQAAKKPLTIVSAGMGCGKTRAVYDFTRECKIPIMWMPLTKSENNTSRFWELLCHAVAKMNKPLSNEMKKIGFPDTQDKMNLFFAMRQLFYLEKHRIYVLDDFHLLKNPDVINFVQISLNKATENCNYIIISREMPPLNISGLHVRDRVQIITEEDLNFTESEMHQLLLKQELDAETSSLSKIYNDTKGWAFIVNFVVRILKKSPGYTGYAQSVIKKDIRQLLELEVWNIISEQLRILLLQLSLTDHRSAELVNILAEGDENLISELKKQNAFIHYDKHVDSYQIHHLLLDFLRTKRDKLSDNEKQKACKTIADWCIKNDFFIDAFFHYKKIGEYNMIVSTLFASSGEFLLNIAQNILEIFDKAPDEVFNNVDFSAAMHIHLTFCQEKYQEAYHLIRYYEKKYLKLPEDDSFRNRMLGCIYYYWGIIRYMQCTSDDCYDFDTYFKKCHEYLQNSPVIPRCWYQHPPGLWSNMAGSARAGAPQEFLDALRTSTKLVQKCTNGLGAGSDYLCQGELLFYQGNIHEAESCFITALDKAQEFKQLEIIYRVLFYLLRIAVIQGDYANCEQILKDMENYLVYNEYTLRFLVYDIFIGWYFYILKKPERIPDWLKEKFSLKYKYANSFESFGNYIKKTYCYLTRNFDELLVFLEEKKKMISVLYERIELLTLEACVHFKMENKEKALRTLKEAYETAQPNDIVMPFIEMGKDMQMVISAALNDQECTIPEKWLKNIKQRSAAYSRNLTRIIFCYKKVNEKEDEIILSPREKEILLDLYNGLSRTEIAAKYGLSINTVKLHINGIYNKTGARNRADIFHIATEYNLL